MWGSIDDHENCYTCWGNVMYVCSLRFLDDGSSVRSSPPLSNVAVDSSVGRSFFCGQCSLLMQGKMKETKIKKKNSRRERCRGQ